MKFTFKKAAQILLILLIMAFQINASAQTTESAKKENLGGGVDVSLTFVSGYLWRGFDLYSAKYDHDQEKYGSFHLVPSLAPSITFSSPTLDGLSFNLWAQFPLQYRNGVEIKDDNGNVTGSAPGLNKADEVDYTVSYSHKSKIGTFSASYLILAFPISGSSYSELAFGCAWEPVSRLNIALSHSIASPMGFLNSGETYTTIKLGYAIEAGKLTITPSIKYGVWDIPVENKYGPGADSILAYSDTVTSKGDPLDNGDNFQHLDLAVDLSFKINEKSSLSIGLLGTYRLLTDNQKYALSPDNGKAYELPALVGQISLGVSYSL